MQHSVALYGYSCIYRYCSCVSLQPSCRSRCTRQTGARIQRHGNSDMSTYVEPSVRTGARRVKPLHLDSSLHSGIDVQLSRREWFNTSVSPPQFQTSARPAAKYSWAVNQTAAAAAALLGRCIRFSWHCVCECVCTQTHTSIQGRC